MKKIQILVTSVFLGLLAASCSVERNYTQTELYFGLSQKDGNTISDSSWNLFMKEHISSVFINGFTVIASEGSWTDRQLRQLHTESSRIVTSVNRMNKQLSGRIDSLRTTYKKLFEQESVLRADKRARAQF